MYALATRSLFVGTGRWWATTQVQLIWPKSDRPSKEPLQIHAHTFHHLQKAIFANEILQYTNGLTSATTPYDFLISVEP